MLVFILLCLFHGFNSIKCGSQHNDHRKLWVPRPDHLQSLLYVSPTARRWNGNPIIGKLKCFEVYGIQKQFNISVAFTAVTYFSIGYCLIDWRLACLHIFISQQDHIYASSVHEGMYTCFVRISHTFCQVSQFLIKWQIKLQTCAIIS